MDRKKDILKNMADSIEHERNALKGINSNFTSDLFQLFNKFIRHDNADNNYISSMSDSEIEEGTILLSHVNISHTNKVGKYCFFAGGTTLGAYTVVEDNVFFGIGCLSISGKVPLIGHDAYIGAGALLTKEVAPYSKMVGIPARNIRDNAL